MSTLAGGTAAVPDWSGRLRGAAERFGRLCVGIDPHAALLDAWGLRGLDGLHAFTDACVDAFAGHVGIVKPQVAFFEAFGPGGLAVLAEAIGELRSAGTLVIADAKRGDIGSTMTAYAQAWLGDDAPFASDAVTLSPYLGFGSLAPALERAEAAGAGVFVLARTSNPEGADLQRSETPGGPSVAQSIVDAAREHNRSGAADTVGLVVGATGTHALDLTDFTGPVLAPGLGAQGATPADLTRIFAGSPALVLPSASRSVLAAGPDVPALRTAAFRLRDEISATEGTHR